MNLLQVIFWLFILQLFAACTSQQGKKKILKRKSDYQFAVIKEVPALSVKDQHASGTCWSFSTASFLESEIIRLKGEEIDLSEMYFVRDAYILKTRNYVMRQGTARFTEGALNHDPIISAAEFGLVPQSAYDGRVDEDAIYDHRKMFEKLEATVKEYANPSRKNGTGWKTEVPAILDNYMGKKPDTFLHKGKPYTPIDFLRYTLINPQDYINITSFTHSPFYQPFILNIPANWANERYYNLPLDEYILNIDHAIEAGFSLALDLDVSEFTFSNEQGIAVLPEKQSDSQIILTEIRPEKIVTQELRQSRFEDFGTTDDHNMHLVGKIKDQHGNIYYKGKNSWGPSSGRQGFIHFSAPYLRMKGISVLLHKDGLIESTRNKLDLKCK